LRQNETKKGGVEKLVIAIIGNFESKSRI